MFEPTGIKVIAFTLNLSSYLVISALLFDEDYIQDRFKEEDETGFFYLIQNEIPRCIYASLAGTLTSLLILGISNSKKRFKSAIERSKGAQEFIINSKKIIKKLKCRVIAFLIINLIVMCAFWYYAAAFCAVYQKTQIAWIQGSGITIVFCILFQIIYSMFITTLRYMGLKCKISCVYTISTYML